MKITVLNGSPRQNGNTSRMINISGQLKCVIDRFYSALYPRAPKTLKKVAMFLSSGDSDMWKRERFGLLVCRTGMWKS